MEAGEVVFQGRDDTGGASALRLNRSSLPEIILRQRQFKANQELKRQQMEEEAARYERKTLDDWYANLKTPNTIDPILRPQIEAAAGNVRAKANSMISNNYGSREVRSNIQPDWQHVMELAAKADKIGTITKDLYDRVEKDAAIDQDLAKPAIYKITHGGHIEDAKPEDGYNILNSGRYIKRPVAIQLSLKDIDDQVRTRVQNGEVDNGLGKMYEFKDRELRFRKDPRTGKYDDGLINLVYESDPRIVKNVAIEFAENTLRSRGIKPDANQIDEVADKLLNGDYANDPVMMKNWNEAKYKGVAATIDQLQTQREMTSYRSGYKYPTNNGYGNVEPQSTVIGDGDSALKEYKSIDHKNGAHIGYDNLAFGFSGNEKSIPFATSKNSTPDQVGMFSGLRTNPNTGEPEMEFVTVTPGVSGQKNIVYAPYDEKTFQQVRTALPPKERVELDQKKKQFDNDFKNRKEYALDDDKLNADADSIIKYYKDNEDRVGEEAFNSGFASLINSLGLDKNAKSNKTFWWFNPNELKIGDKTIPVDDKAKLKQVLYDLQKGRYKKQKNNSAGPSKSEADELGLND